METLLLSDDVVDSPNRARLGGKRKAVKPTRDMVSSRASVEPLTIEEMTIKVRATNCQFQRLKFKGCPKLSNYGKRNKKIQYIDMNRDAFIRDMYRLLSPNCTITTTKHYYTLCGYIGWMDDNKHKPVADDYFHNELIKLYMQEWGTWNSQNIKSKTAWANVRKMFSFILKRLDRHHDAKRLAPIKGIKKETNSHKGLYLEEELKPIARALFRGFKGFAKHLEDNTTPQMHALWDEELFNEQVDKHGWNATKKEYQRKGFRTSIAGQGDWRNHLTRVSAMICFMLTGMNLTPMLSMKRKDVKFKQIQGGQYIFEAVKGRANNLEIDNGIGFSKYAKEFIERWLSLSARLTGKGKNASLFPYIKPNGDISDFITGKHSPHQSINKFLITLGLKKISASILRQTKIDTLMKVTEDIYLVSVAANNSIGVITSNYSSGLEQDHKRNLSASMVAKFDLAKGKPINEAVAEAKKNNVDVLSAYEYKKLRENSSDNDEAQTPLGGRCQSNKKGAAERIDKILKKKGIEMPKEEKRCTDFFGCFECEHHKLVAEVDDIWLMLSFQGTLREMLQYPSVNSLPDNDYKNLCITVDSALDRFKEKSKVNYLHALEKIKSGNHPLYETVYSLNDLLEVFS